MRRLLCSCLVVSSLSGCLAEPADTHRGVHNLALLYRDQGRWGEAEPLFQQALEASERNLGPEHPDTVAIVNNLDGHEISGSVMRMVDDSLEQFLRNIYQTDPNTVVVLMSDHGSHSHFLTKFSKFSQLDHHLALMMMMMPKSMLENDPTLKGKLESSEQSLVTAFSIYETLRHLGTYPNQPDPLPALGKEFRTVASAYQSLLNGDIKTSRTCKQAGLDEGCWFLYGDELQTMLNAKHL